MKVDALMVTYRKGVFSNHQGIKNTLNWSPKFIKSFFVVGGGNGTFCLKESETHFVLWIRVENTQHQVWLESIFRKLLNRKHLTAELRQKISDTMPDQVEVIRKFKNNGVGYYVLSDDSARIWAQKIL